MKRRTRLWLANHPNLPEELKDGLVKALEEAK